MHYVLNQYTQTRPLIAGRGTNRVLGSAAAGAPGAKGAHLQSRCYFWLQPSASADAASPGQRMAGCNLRTLPPVGSCLGCAQQGTRMAQSLACLK